MSKNQLTAFDRPLNVAFLGRGEFGYQVLTGLLEKPHVNLKVIMTCRHTPEVLQSEETFQALADANQIPFHLPKNINSVQWVALLKELNCDLAVAINWFNVIKKDVIETVDIGFLNCHGGLLPRYRGNACSNWAILNDAQEQGISVHFMDAGKLDSGPVLLQYKIPMDEHTTIEYLMDTISAQGARLVLESVDRIHQGNITPVAQDESKALYCYPRLPRDGEIYWNLPAHEIEKLVRASGRPYPGAYSYFADIRDQHRIKKMTLWATHIETLAIDFCAVPGHLLKLDNGQKWAVVCGDQKLIVLDEIDIDGKTVLSQQFFKTIRQRFGLDNATLLNEIHKPRTLEQLGGQFLAVTQELDALEAQVADVIDQTVARLNETQPGSVAANPIRNYSFQKRFYDLKQAETWFGVQVYRSFRLLGMEEEPIALGYWFFSEPERGLRQRIYVSVKQSHAPQWTPVINNIMLSEGSGSEISTFPQKEWIKLNWTWDITGISDLELVIQKLENIGTCLLTAIMESSAEQETCLA